MTDLHLALPIALLALCWGTPRGDARADEPRPVEETRLTLTGTIRMPDGSSAPGATIEAPDDPDEPPIVARADGSGRFRLRGIFGNGTRLHARSADRNHQATRIIAAGDVRSISMTPIELALVPALHHEVVVVAGDRPVEGAHVVASGFDFEVHGVTGPDGKVALRLPAGERLRRLNAWHPVSGVRGTDDLADRPPQGRTQLSLLRPAPLRIRVVDPDGRPVAGLELGVSFRVGGSDWAVVDKIVPARVRSGADGTAIVPWAPREKLEYVDPRVVGPDWKVDSTDVEKVGERVVTVHVRRMVPVEGKLVMPAGASAEGLLVTGFGFGPGNRGDIPYARARADGSFTLRIAPEHGYVLGIVDLGWAGTPWTGLIRGQSITKHAAIAISVARATPVTVRVTRGPRRTPVAGAWVDVDSRMDVTWLDPAGKKKTGGGRIGSGLRTDENGEARAGAGPGKCGVRLVSGAWNEERTIVISPGKPAEVHFHRAWEGERHIAGRLLSDDKPFSPSQALVARAWSSRRLRPPEKFRPEVAPDGTVRVAFDAENLALFFSDPAKHRSGFARLGLEGSSVDVEMVAMGTYAGILIDEEGKPMAGQSLSLAVKDSGGEPVATEKTDESGRFRFAAVPARTPLSLWFADRTMHRRYFLAEERLFEPGEVREDDRVQAHPILSPAPVARRSAPTAPLADRIANACRNARVSGMHALVILQGAGSGKVSTLANQLLDYDRSPLILKYLPVEVEPGELETKAAAIAKRGWPVPAPGQVVLVAMDGDRRTIATKVIAADPPASAQHLGDAFLKQHAPPTRDALARLSVARDEARKTGRRVWVVLGGPRCGPCFRLGRWIEEHHATLEKDFVIVKVMGGLDVHSAEIFEALPIADGDGIPWYAITEPDGTVLVTSHGPLGNLGFPTTVEDLRHLRRMLEGTARKLTAAEIDGLIGSLGPKP